MVSADDLHKSVYQELLRVARNQNVTFYSDIAPLAGLDMSLPPDRTAIGELLGTISRYEHQEGRPMLSAVVVDRQEHRPGPGFFSLAEELGLFEPASDDREAFFVAELGRVHSRWRGR